MTATRHANLHLILVFALMLFSMFLGGCSRRNMEEERQQALNQVYTKLRSCLPPEEQTDDKLKIAILDVKVNPKETAVRIVAYTLDEEIDFDLPVYSLSRGRWLINEKGRAYLLDERCREYKLQDRRPVPNHPIPLNGRIHLNPGQAFEAILSFPRMSDTQIGVLVYGQRIMPFWFLKQGE
ncbi:MAG: hypothetical protein J2P41_20535 [Blastocatellia bacterium]|nr:hypothetical protein [Blastocatellia bacterium]